MPNEKDIINYPDFKWMKRKEKAIKHCNNFTNSDNIHCYSKKKINKLVPLDFIEKVSADMGPQNFLPADICY